MLAVLADLDSVWGCMHVCACVSEKMNTFMNSRHENLEAIIKDTQTFCQLIEAEIQ